MFLSFTLCYIPQIIKIYKNKSAENVSIFCYLLTSSGCLSGLIYIVNTSFDFWIFLNQLLGLSLSVWTMYLCYKYDVEK